MSYIRRRLSIYQDLGPYRTPRDLSYVVFSEDDLSATGKQISFLLIFKEYRKDVKGKGKLQVYLRCLEVEPKRNPSSWTQRWPCPCSAMVNMSLVKLEIAQRLTDGYLSGRNKGTDITQYLFERRCGNRQNFFTLRRANSANQ